MDKIKPNGYLGISSRWPFFIGIKMKLPEIFGHKKLRDFQIIKMYSEGSTQEDIGIMFGIDQSRVSAIIYRNRHVINSDKMLEKIKRINHLKRLIDKAPKESRKDVADLLAQLKDEMEDDKGIIINQNTNVNVQRDKVVIFRDIKDELNGKDISSDVYARQGTKGNISQEKI